MEQAELVVQSQTADLPRKPRKLVHRAKALPWQRVRHGVQAAFLLLNAWIAIQFYLWVRYFERGGAGLYLPRPAGVEGWLPIAGFMNFKYLLMTGRVPAVHPAAMFLFLAFVLTSLLLKKAFCSWLCPVGTFSEFLWKLGRHFLGRNLHLPRWVDLPLRSLKYILLGFFVFVIGTMSAEAIESFMQTPYGLLADVKMLNFFRYIGSTAVIVIAVLVFASLLVKNFWCRYLCPYGGLMGLVSLLSPVKIRRDAEACVNCGKCANACPASLPVDHLVQIHSVECTGCVECVAVCQVQGALQFALPPRPAAQLSSRWSRRVLRPAAVAGIVAVLFLGTVLFARITGHWHTNLPRAMYMDLVPEANQFGHAGF